MKEFCPKCGSTKGPFVRGFCVNCFTEKNNPFSVPKEFKIERCKKCDKVELSGTWQEFSDKNLINFLESKVKILDLEKAVKKITLKPISDKKTEILVKLHGEIDSVKLDFEKKLLLNEKTACCLSCSRVYGNYFEAVIQLRFEKKSSEFFEQKLEKIKKLLFEMEKRDPLAKIIKFVAQKNGADLFIGSNRSAKKVSFKMENSAKQKVIVSKSLQGIDKNKGKERFRYTYCLRF